MSGNINPFGFDWTDKEVVQWACANKGTIRDCLSAGKVTNPYLWSIINRLISIAEKAVEVDRTSRS